MRVLHVIPSVSPLRGGPSAVIRMLARGLSAEGITVHIATTDDNGPGRLSVPLGQPIKEEGATFWYFPRQMRPYTISWPLLSWLWRHVPEYDLVHIHALFSFPVTAAALCAAHRRVPYLVRPLGTLTQWGVLNRRPLLKRLSIGCVERHIMAGTAAVHFTSDDEAEEARLSVDFARNVIIPNPVSLLLNENEKPTLSFRDLYPQLRGRRIVLFLSRIDRKKGLDLLIEAFAKIRQTVADASLVIVGSGDLPLELECRNRADQLGISSDVHWIGFLEGAEKQAALTDADLFVLPSYSENFGVAVVEAMAAGLPVVVTDRVAIHREIASQRAGLVVKCNIDRLAGAIRQLLQDRSLSTELGRNGCRLAACFAPSIIAAKLRACYEEILQTRAGPPLGRSIDEDCQPLL